LFEKEHMYEKIEAEIQAIERQKRREQGDLSDVSDDEADKEPLDHLEVQKLIHRVRTRFNLELV
jgi:predicted lipoprotein